MVRLLRALLSYALFGQAGVVFAADLPDCSRPLTLGLHEHGLLYSSDTNTGIDKDFADELILRSGCMIIISVMPRDRIWQLIESGALDFSLSGIANPDRERFAAFAWYFSNKYYLLVRKDANVQRLTDFEQKERLQLGCHPQFSLQRERQSTGRQTAERTTRRLCDRPGPPLRNVDE